MIAVRLTFAMALTCAAGVALAAFGCGGGGGGYDSGTPTGPSPGGGGASSVTVTIRAGGTVDPKEVRISIGQQVRFVNEDAQAHHVQSNPHGQHNECTETNVAIINPGQSATTQSFGRAKSCGYHDHMNPETTGLHGIIRVGGDSGPTGPVYIVPD